MKQWPEFALTIECCMRKLFPLNRKQESIYPTTSEQTALSRLWSLKFASWINSLKVCTWWFWLFMQVSQPSHHCTPCNSHGIRSSRFWLPKGMIGVQYLPSKHHLIFGYGKSCMTNWQRQFYNLFSAYGLSCYSAENWATILGHFGASIIGENNVCYIIILFLFCFSVITYYIKLPLSNLD